jgi:hypothetical protein
MPTSGPKLVKWFMYFDTKQVTLDGTIIYFNRIIVSSFHAKARIIIP